MGKLNLGVAGDIIGVIAPAIATALGGPLAGLAVRALSSVFLGKDDGSLDEVKNVLAGATPDQVAQLKKVNDDFLVQMKGLDIDLEKINQMDRQSARDMQSSSKSWIPGLLALGVTTGFFGILVGMAFFGLKNEGNQAFLILLGSLSTSFSAIIGFYYGSSSSSHLKDETIAKMGLK